jgi:ABC-type ATPase with predicted acetyltransferase domain
MLIDFQNLNELRELLQKAIDQLEQLEATLKQVQNFEFKVVQQRAYAATTDEITNSNGCTECGRAWNSNLRYCGICGNRLVPVSQLKKFFPQRKFTRVN